VTSQLVHITETRCGTCKHLYPLAKFWRRKDEISYCCEERVQNGELTFEPLFFAERCELYEAKAVKVEA